MKIEKNTLKTEKRQAENIPRTEKLITEATKLISHQEQAIITS